MIEVPRTCVYERATSDGMSELFTTKHKEIPLTWLCSSSFSLQANVWLRKPHQIRFLWFPFSISLKIARTGIEVTECFCSKNDVVQWKILEKICLVPWRLKLDTYINGRINILIFSQESLSIWHWSCIYFWHCRS